MSIPYAIPKARSDYRAGRIGPREYLQILQQHGYTRREPESNFRSIGEIAAIVVENLQNDHLGSWPQARDRPDHGGGT